MATERTKIVVLAVDGLRAAALGAYGAAWCETPALDQLASESFLCDQFFLPTPTLAGAYEGFWQGRHPLEASCGARPSLARLLREAGIRSTLLTDESQLAALFGADDFDDLVQLPTPQAAQPVESLEETHLARIFSTAIEALAQIERDEADQPSLLWVHARGMAGPWDAPLELRQSLVDEEDPPPPQTAEAPRIRLPPDHDPDEVLGWTYAYTGQVMALDACVAALLDHLHGSTLGQETLLVLVGAGGFPLGEHRQIGPVEESLYGEQLHVPCLLRFPDERGKLARTGALAEPGDLPATLLDWLRQEVPFPAARRLMPLIEGTTDAVRDRIACVTTSGRRALRTDSWHAIFSPDGERTELYVKPDDRWEANEVSVRLPEIAAELRSGWEEFAQAAQAGKLSSLPPLDPAAQK